MNNKHTHILYSAVRSAIVVAIFIAVVTIAGELLPPLKGWLKETFFHHWIGKGVLSILLFFALATLDYMYVSGKKEVSVASALMILFWVSFIAVFSILGFYLYEVFLVHA